MAITKIRISNFKSFKELKIELGKFNVLIGANASGKSNFIQIFRFLRDMVSRGLDNAISLQGGVEHLRNINIGSRERFSLEVVSDLEVTTIWERKEKTAIEVRLRETTYAFAMEFKRKGRGFNVVRDELTQKLHFVRLAETRSKKFEKKEDLGQGELMLSFEQGKLKHEINLPEGLPLEEKDVYESFPPDFFGEELRRKAVLLSLPLYHPFHFVLADAFRNISIYDFDPKLPKKGQPIAAIAELEEDGRNLAIVLKSIRENKEKRRKLFNLVRDVIPFVVTDGLRVRESADKSLLFELQEIYSRDHYLPASLISDGTINIMALVTALYFEQKPLAIIEEPERNIHPYLISKVTNMMKDASQTKQIIVSTHNPEVVRHADLEDILLVSRDKDGFSTITRPSEKEEVKTFLKNELGIEDLYVQNLLEI